MEECNCSKDESNILQLGFPEWSNWSKKPRTSRQQILQTESQKLPTVAESPAVDPMVQNGPSYRCNQCAAVFTSPQALGGHKASHRRKQPSMAGDKIPAAPSGKRVHKCSICNASFATGQALGGHQTLHRRHISPISSKRNVVHRCSICNEEFTTGQALGGHMRRHYEGDLSRGSRRQQTDDHIGSVSSSKPCLNIELNKSPTRSDNEYYDEN
ncbi:zinc finger protein ZAT11-like [Andrographis paniculata]|uniref:zinc finger protein ZAT11-like n=1 Tax=Andrographis paniculata TaxID=175694 RepID=UPI0021E93FEC|nr:zinc finger protein ZAT11-like [Andrographis paniculata]XP_051125547.1 zinc finger protein ZAT11-like [Andrographis paniculata]